MYFYVLLPMSSIVTPKYPKSHTCSIWSRFDYIFNWSHSSFTAITLIFLVFILIRFLSKICFHISKFDYKSFFLLSHYLNSENAHSNISTLCRCCTSATYCILHISDMCCMRYIGRASLLYYMNVYCDVYYKNLLARIVYLKKCLFDQMSDHCPLINGLQQTPTLGVCIGSRLDLYE